jgi:hypothetical protein
MAKVKINMKTAKALTRKPRRKNIIGNMRGAEDRLWINVARGMRKFLESPFKKYKK